MSLNLHTIIGVVGHFINKNGRYYYIVLFCDYRIIGNIRYFIANNTELNNTCINAILYILYLNISTNLYKGRRLYYFSYIINLYT